jgi:hypothetical protein
MLDADRDIIAIACPFKYQQWQELAEAVKLGGIPIFQSVSTQYNIVPPDPRKDWFDWGADGIAEVAWVGAALMLISRACAERVVAAHPELVTVSPPHAEKNASVFAPMHCAALNEELSEDFSFCERARQLGMKVHAIVDETVMHTTPFSHVGRCVDRIQFCGELARRRADAATPAGAPDP